MDLSVCIVSYNCRELLRACLLSVEREAVGLEHEVIVADNASDDGTVEMVAREFPGVVCLANEQNLGFAAATNQAMARACGEVLLMLNPDTEVQPGALEYLVSFVRSHPWMAAAGPRIVGPAGELQPTCHPFPTVGQTLIAQLGLHRLFPGTRLFGGYDMTWWDHAEPRRVDWVSGACLAVSRAAWEEVGPLDAGYFMYSEEVDWCYRLAQAGLECWYLPEAEVVHHEAASWGAASRERILASHRANFRFFGKHYGAGAELMARLLVTFGALARGSTWNIVGPLHRGRRSNLITDPAVHFAVANQALRLEQMYRQRTAVEG